MKISINRNSGLFTPAQSDQINKAFDGINHQIDEYVAPDLDYKEPVQVMRGSSFKTGNLLCIRDTFTLEGSLEEFTFIGNLDCSVTFDVWGNAVSENNEIVKIHITGNSLYVIGRLSYYPQRVYLSQDVVLPN